jgi:hypothetical protein
MIGLMRGLVIELIIELIIGLIIELMRGRCLEKGIYRFCWFYWFY